jgi:hypothetical protein
MHMSSQSEQDLSNFQTLVSVATERPRLTIAQQKNILSQTNANVKCSFSRVRMQSMFLSLFLLFSPMLK